MRSVGRPAGIAQSIKRVGAPRSSETHWGTVTAVNDVTPRTVTVTVNGGPVTARYMASYSPEEGDTVIMELLGSDDRGRSRWICRGALA